MISKEDASEKEGWVAGNLICSDSNLLFFLLHQWHVHNNRLLDLLLRLRHRLLSNNNSLKLLCSRCKILVFLFSRNRT
jgi:hypothetical protein